jgi:16S rRNA (uracil1498-N3)-methyltransferase
VAHVFAAALDDRVVVDGPDGHHLERVRRLAVDEPVTVGDGAGAWRPYRVVATGRARLELEATDVPVTEPSLTPALTAAVALTKGEKPERVVAGLTELGVDRIGFVHARRSALRWDAARAETSLVRLRRIAREAAMQCRRSRLPEIDGPWSLADLAGDPTLVVADVGGGRAEELPAGPGGWTLLIGPEGGLAPDELEALAGAPRLGLGPHVLRAETAAVAAAGVLTARRRAE